MNGNEVMVKYLCEQGADVKLLDKESRSVIHWITGKVLENNSIDIYGFF